MIQTKALTIDTWNDFASLMQTDAQCSECWCLNHREPAGCATGKAAQIKMRELTANNGTHGILAYSGDECVGWLAIDPMEALVGHDCQPTGKDAEWAIHCMFVKDGFRGHGLSKILVHAGTAYAKARGAKLVSAFPIPAEHRTKFPANEAEFSGRFSTYEKSGFKSVGPAADFYQRMELTFER